MRRLVVSPRAFAIALLLFPLVVHAVEAVAFGDRRDPGSIGHNDAYQLAGLL